jgi:hypothetical protein
MDDVQVFFVNVQKNNLRVGKHVSGIVNQALRQAHRELRSTTYYDNAPAVYTYLLDVKALTCSYAHSDELSV